LTEYDEKSIIEVRFPLLKQGAFPGWGVPLHPEIEFESISFLVFFYQRQVLLLFYIIIKDPLSVISFTGYVIKRPGIVYAGLSRHDFAPLFFTGLNGKYFMPSVYHFYVYSVFIRPDPDIHYLSSSATFLIFFPASTGARIIAPNFGFGASERLMLTIFFVIPRFKSFRAQFFIFL